MPDEALGSLAALAAEVIAHRPVVGQGVVGKARVVSVAPPAGSAADAFVRLLAASAVKASPAAAIDHADGLEPQHAPGFEWIRVQGHRYDFLRERERDVVRVLWAANCAPLHEDSILRAIDPVRAARGESFRVRDVFRGKDRRMHPAWTNVIRSEGARTRMYRLAR